MTNYSSGNKKTVLITIVAGIAVLGFLIWWVKQPQVYKEVGVSPTPTPDVESATINQDIDSVNILDLNAEFDAIDKDLQGL